MMMFAMVVSAVYAITLGVVALFALAKFRGLFQAEEQRDQYKDLAERAMRWCKPPEVTEDYEAYEADMLDARLMCEPRDTPSMMQWREAQKKSAFGYYTHRKAEP